MLGELLSSVYRLKAGHCAGQRIQLLRQGVPHPVPILPRLQGEKRGGLLTATVVGEPFNSEEVGIVGDGGVLVDVKDLLVPAHAVQLLLQLPDPLVEGSLPGQGGVGGGGLKRQLSLGELLQL